LFQREQMLGPVVAHQRFGDERFTGLDALVAQFGQHARITLPSQDRVDDGEPGLPRDVTDDVMQLQVHLIQRLLHVVDVGRRHLHETLAVAEQRPDRADFLLRSIRRAQ